MATKQELLNQIKSIQKQIANKSTPDNVRENMRVALENINKQIADLEEQEKKAAQAASVTPSGGSSASQVSAIAKSGQTGSATNALITGLEKALDVKMGGMGMDEEQLKKLIDEKVKEMGASVSFEQLKPFIEQYLKTAREIEITIPKYGVTAKITQDDSIIPNFFKVIDDVLVGNNVFLIGEAGTGKTFLAKRVAKALKRDIYTINCSQYTTPIDIIGGETINGFKEGKLLLAWEKGGILLLDEMAKLDANTAGLFNDPLAMSSKTEKDADATISNPRKGGAPIPRNALFACIATGNVYPNRLDMSRYVGNNQQDLSLLDRFSGGVYFVGYNNRLDATLTRYKFIYDLFVGKESGTGQGMRYYMIQQNYTNFAVVSLRTLIAVRVSFELQLVREIKKRNGEEVIQGGKTFADAVESYLVAFDANPVAKNDLINKYGLTRSNLDDMANKAIDLFMNKEWKKLLTDEFNKNGAVSIEELESMSYLKGVYQEEEKITINNG